MGDSEAVTEAAKELENRIKLFAKTIRDKYIGPPRTTEFAILYLPTEGLYAEILRRPGLFEQLQREFHVTLTGPTTFTALLNALQMGFRSLAIEKRSSEVWQILGAVSAEFGKYNEVVDKLSKQLSASIFVADHLRPAAKKTGVHIEDGQRFGLHNLRHSLSNWLVNKAKVEPKTVQGILRHAKIQTTLDLYTQEDGDETRAAQGEYLTALGVATAMVQ